MRQKERRAKKILTPTHSHIYICADIHINRLQLLQPVEALVRGQGQLFALFLCLSLCGSQSLISFHYKYWLADWTKVFDWQASRRSDWQTDRQLNWQVGWACGSSAYDKLGWLLWEHRDGNRQCNRNWHRGDEGHMVQSAKWRRGERGGGREGLISIRQRVMYFSFNLIHLCW